MARPHALDDHAKINVLDTDGKVGGNLLSNDTASGGSALYLRFVDGIRVGDKGVDTIQGQYGTFTFKADGSYIYTLDTSNPAVSSLAHNATLVEHIDYKISDGQGNTDVAQLSLVIEGPNATPKAADETFNLDLHTSTTFTGNVLAGDTDSDGDTLHTSFIGSGSPLTYIPNNGGETSFTGEYGTISIGRDGNFTYTADTAKVDAAIALGETPVEHFVYKVWDGHLTNSSDQGDLYIDLAHSA